LNSVSSLHEGVIYSGFHYKKKRGGWGHGLKDFIFDVNLDKRNNKKKNSEQIIKLGIINYDKSIKSELKPDHLGQEKKYIVCCCPTDPNFLVPTLNFFRDF